MKKIDLRGNKRGWSTRYKFHSLPKHVYLFQSSTSKKKFRVCKKVFGKTITIGYYKTLEQATKIAKLLHTAGNKITC